METTMRFKKTAESTIIDTDTGLEWQTKTSNRLMNWREANEYAEFLGDGWRLPTIKELSTLIDYSRISPATTFPGHGNNYFWSSSVRADYTSFAWAVYFDYGYVYYHDKSHDYRVRCVRCGLQEGRLGSLIKAEARVVELEDEISRLARTITDIYETMGLDDCNADIIGQIKNLRSEKSSCTEKDSNE